MKVATTVSDELFTIPAGLEAEVGSAASQGD
jgi:hypothetical protein